jgi:jumonji domain-containing protein 2
LGPTMESSMYGADMEGSLFDQDDDACGWNPSRLESCLSLLSTDANGESLPGVTTPYLYFGMWASVFCA